MNANTNTTPPTAGHAQSGPDAKPGKKPRDLRLDFFRGLAMFIILLAHTPGNAWTLWIPARFGFSDATEIFVFCSGMASAMAFGAVFAKKSWFLGAARIAFRVWQVYWAHIGVVLATALMMVALDKVGFGEPGRAYADTWFPLAGLFSRTHETLLGLFTLTYIPGLFDILPMYLVILALVPVVMTLHRLGGKEAVFAFVLLTWLAANLAGYARHSADATDLTMLGEAFRSAGQLFLWMNLPGIPWIEGATWFFNPFGWQLVFFTGFSFAMGWLPAPPVNRVLVGLAIGVVLITIPLAWHKMFQWMTGYVPQHWGGEFFWDAREDIAPLRWKSWVGAWRFVHFLAIAYLAWAAVGVDGNRLRTGWSMVERSGARRLFIRVVTGIILIVTAPYAYLNEIAFAAPWLDQWIIDNYLLLPARYIGIALLVHLTALIMFVWHSIGDEWRRWLLADAFLATVPVIRKVGTQSLAVFLVSIVLSRFSGRWMDHMDAWLIAHDVAYFEPRDAWMLLLVNGTGIGILIATAYLVGWFKSEPWRGDAKGHQAKHRKQDVKLSQEAPVAATRSAV
ncbi:MAG: OpgC family protein [Pikeienuella sp.]